jgi:RimJ/RimL family protein N-acetyltransferase
MLINGSLAGKYCALRNINVSDAEFIVSLRKDNERNQFLNAIQPDFFVQSEYIESQRDSINNIYLVIEDLQHNKVGTVKITDIDTNRPSWGSWAIVPGTNPRIGPESAILTYKIIAELSSFDNVVFTVSIGNESVRRFHERCGASVTKTTDIEYEMSITRDAILLLL